MNALRELPSTGWRFAPFAALRHESGLHLAASSEMTTSRSETDAVLKLLRIARQEFDYVVVDAGSRFEAQDAF